RKPVQRDPRGGQELADAVDRTEQRNQKHQSYGGRDGERRDSRQRPLYHDTVRLGEKPAQRNDDRKRVLLGRNLLGHADQQDTDPEHFHEPRPDPAIERELFRKRGQILREVRPFPTRRSSDLRKPVQRDPRGGQELADAVDRTEQRNQKHQSGGGHDAIRRDRQKGRGSCKARGGSDGAAQASNEQIAVLLGRKRRGDCDKRSASPR